MLHATEVDNRSERGPNLYPDGVLPHIFFRAFPLHSELLSLNDSGVAQETHTPTACLDK